MPNLSDASSVELRAERANQRNALLAGFLGWTLDAFDFFVLTYVLSDVARDFHRTRPDIALTLTASLAMRPVGAIIFGLMADRYGRRLPLMLDVIFYSVIEVLSGLATSYRMFMVLRLLYGIGMGGEWGVGASLTMESVPARWRGILSGLLQEGYALGNILAAVAYFTIFPHHGWRALFFVGGLPALLSLFIRAKVKESAAWHATRTDWSTYWSVVRRNWRRFLYLVVLMTMMNFMSHGTQDLYPTFLSKQRGYDPHATAIISIIAMVGAICGGLAFGAYSDRKGRRRAMITAALLGLAVIPLWILSPTTALLIAGGFLMQFMVQGAWGVIPAHINELSPGELRGFFPGFAYQIGVLFASSISYVEPLLGERFSYTQSMGLLAAAVLSLAAIVVYFGPEAKGVHFG
ncbi:MAG TPA: MFS transporter [Terriglobales bacterium]|nr:MFS transporter [Terriglobales bacterium]